MKIKAEKLSEKEMIRTLDTLYTCVGAIRGREAMKMFLRDLLTKSERIMLGRRIIVARKLIEGSSYSDISNEMGVGHDTIWKIQRWLNDQMPGYEQAIEGMRKEFNRRNEKRLYAQSALYRLKKRYPLHFLLFPTPKLRSYRGTKGKRKQKISKRQGIKK